MSNPLGTIIAFYGGDNLRPNGYLFCNGEPISSGNYPDLYLFLIAANPKLYVAPTICRLPELRGEFLRGWDNGRNVDLNRTLGADQSDAFQFHRHVDEGHSHDHNLGELPASSGRDGGNAPTAGPMRKGNISVGRAQISGPVPMDATPVRLAGETRPRNVAVSFLIASIRIPTDLTREELAREAKRSLESIEVSAEFIDEILK